MPSGGRSSGLTATALSPPKNPHGLGSWAALIYTRPAPKGNSKKVVPDLSSRRCGTCGKYARRKAVPRTSDVKAERALTQLLSLVGPPEVFRRDVLLRVSIVLPIRKSWSAAKKAAALKGTCRPTSNKGATGPIPDLGNLEKLLDDALEHGGWVANDSVIAERESRKVYGEHAGYAISVLELPTWTE